MLYILTYADMNAVNENIYSGFSAKLLREFYTFSMEMFNKEELIDETARRLRRENILKKSPEFLALSKNLQKKTLSIQSNFFFLKQKFNSNHRQCSNLLESYLKHCYFV